MKRYNKNLGDFGEEAAESFLKEKGFVILKRNYNTAFGEIDIIAFDKNMLVFTEVKTRSSLKYGMPVEAIDKNKKIHMKRAAGEYFAKHPTENEIRFDVVEVSAVLNNGFYELENINHIEDVII